MVSWDANNHAIYWAFKPVDSWTTEEFLEQMVLDVAYGRARATDAAFSHRRVRYIIDSCRAWSPVDYPEMAEEADRLESLMAQRPGLFV